jgi:isocitrate dehydrogenase
MVNSDKGITNLHVPRRDHRRLDARRVRDSGQMWGPDGKPGRHPGVIPDRCYAGDLRRGVSTTAKAHGAFDPATMGSVPNVGLMAQKAEEYGSHDKTFSWTPTGLCGLWTSDGDVLMAQRCPAGDIWRMCQTRDSPCVTG